MFCGNCGKERDALLCLISRPILESLHAWRTEQKVCYKQSLKSELSHLKKTFEANGYPPSLISRNPPTNTKRQQWPRKPVKKMIYLPYVQQTSDHIQRICRQIGVQVVFKSQNTLREALMKVKNPRPQLLKKGVIYEVPCMDCNRSFIGEMGRWGEPCKRDSWSIKQQ